MAYCLRIVDLDPINYDLLFERFLNPGRKQMPDIDMDFDERYRADVMRYAAEKYGSDRVAQVVTFSTIKARAAVRDAARVLGKAYIVGDRIAKAMPPLVMGRDTPLKACMTKTEGHEEGFAAAAELRAMYDTDPEAKETIDVALGLEGLRRQDGIHAAAVVISRDPLTDYLPIQRKPEAGGKPEDAPIVTQYEMHGVEELGPVEDGLPGAAQPVDHRAHAGPDRRPSPASGPTSTAWPSTTSRRWRCCAGPTPSASSSSRARPCARPCGRWPRPASTTWPPSSPSTGPGRWRPTCTATTPS